MNRPHRPRQFVPAGQRGQVLVVTVLATVLLVGLIFFIMNVGDQVNRRTAVQNAADSAAISGAVHMARSLNTIALNNVAMSRMLALVPIMDSLPLNVRLSHEQIEARIQAIDNQLTLQGQFPSDAMRQPMIDGLNNVRQWCEKERAILQPMNALLNPDPNPANCGNPLVTRNTVYSQHGVGGPQPHGAFWQAARHLDEFNQATDSVAGVAAQQAATHYARVSGAEAGFIVPLVPDLPAERGQWRDWYRDPGRRDTVLWDGWIPELGFPPRWKGANMPEPYTPQEIDALQRHAGGFNKVLYDAMSRDESNRWRHPIYAQGDRGTWAQGDNFVVSGNPGGISAGVSSLGSLGHFTGGTRGPVIGYQTYGPMRWMFNRVRTYWNDTLPRSRVYLRTAQGGQAWAYEELVNTKLDYMFRSSDGEPSAKMVHFPLWINDYDAAKNTWDNGGDCEQTVYFGILIVSDVGPLDSNFASGLTGSTSNNLSNPSVTTYDGWVDRSDDTSMSANTKNIGVGIRVTVNNAERTVYVGLTKKWTKVANHVWEVTFSPAEIQTEIENSAAGAVPVEPLPWIICRDIFGGADFGGQIDISNPANYASRAELPAPMLLAEGADQFELNYPRRDVPGVLRDKFTMFAVAKRSTAPTAWAQRFSTANPLGEMIGVAQVEIFNPTSWDLWTQDWHAQLAPVSGVGDWAVKMRSDPGAGYPHVNAQDVSDASEYLSRFGSWLDLAIGH